MKKDKRIWSFPISIFKDWKKDDDEYLRKCFETDFNNTRIGRIIKSQEDLAEVKEILWKFYKFMKEAYK